MTQPMPLKIKYQKLKHNGKTVTFDKFIYALNVKVNEEIRDKLR